MYFCSNCSSEFCEKGKKCPKCGAHILKEKDYVVQIEKIKKEFKNRKYYLTILWFLSGVLAFILIFVLLGMETSQPLLEVNNNVFETERRVAIARVAIVVVIIVLLWFYIYVIKNGNDAHEDIAIKCFGYWVNLDVPKRKDFDEDVSEAWEMPSKYVKNIYVYVDKNNGTAKVWKCKQCDVENEITYHKCVVCGERRV